ncbi:LysR family transcriptional regulator [Variovorax sp. PCZ-1]|uniref:LysR family transcriptional regulator n=1 Tax=Variovorax sp. PCZ-1 TaxID=2835533 RepID=UPI001BCEA5DF|nr:LysR family transcriptional regulator [Variovorax sp. PCZ-1]MBS7807792.1 LysR family transcriptional regulator [Variovorax sp. PCZ-1]
MDKFKEMQSFVAVAESGSFVKAADELETSKAAVSRYVAQLEERLGVRLMNRTTRRLSLTDEGHAFLAHCKETLSLIEDAEEEIQSKRNNATGLVRINAPVSFGILHLAPLWGKFTQLYPQVKLDVTLSDRVVDLVDEGFDIAIRVARLPSSTLISRKLASTSLVVCASPKYLKGKSKPSHPRDLKDHSIISYSYLATGDEWVFQGPEGEIRVKTQPQIHTNNGDTCRSVALTHQGIIMQPNFIVSRDIQNGDLVELLPQFKSAELGIYAVYPSRKLVSKRIRVLVDFLVKEFEQINFGAELTSPSHLAKSIARGSKRN